MGRGIALQFKKEFPDNFKAYARACKREEVQPGRMLYEMEGVTEEIAREAFRLAAAKLPFGTAFVARQVM